MTHEPDIILNRAANGTKKYDPDYIARRFQTEREEIYPLFIADMDYRLPDIILDALNGEIRKGDFGYFDVPDVFYHSIVGWYQEQHRCQIAKDWIIPAFGTIASLHFALQALLEPADAVAIFTPVYAPLHNIVVYNQFQCVTQSLLEQEGRYFIDFSTLEEDIVRQNIKAMIICHPHNPSGRIWRTDEMARLLVLCQKYQLYLFVDEIHGELAFTMKNFCSFAHYFSAYERIIVASSPNKSFNLPALHGSYLLCGNSVIRNKITSYFSRNLLEINRVACQMIPLCYQLGQSWLEQVRAVLKANVHMAMAVLSGSATKIFYPDAGYLLWVKLHYVTDTDRFVIALANETGVLLETGSRFVENGNGYIRINLAMDRLRLREALERLRNFYEQYQS